jgi:hypothetical protein
MGIFTPLPTSVKNNTANMYCGLIPIFAKAKVNTPICMKKKSPKRRSK